MVIQVFKRAFNYNISNRRPLWLYQFIYLALHENENKTSESKYVKGVLFFNKSQNGYLFCQKGKGLDLGAEPTRIKLC